MNARRLLHGIDQISYWSGKAFAWLIVALTFVVSIEVFKRYILNAPTAWIFDFSNMLYGTLFMMCGAYTLALSAHVRADFVYIYLKPRGQAALGGRGDAGAGASASPPTGACRPARRPTSPGSPGVAVPEPPLLEPALLEPALPPALELVPAFA